MATFPFPRSRVGTRLKAVTDRTRPPTICPPGYSVRTGLEGIFADTHR